MDPDKFWYRLTSYSGKTYRLTFVFLIRRRLSRGLKLVIVKKCCNVKGAIPMQKCAMTGSAWPVVVYFLGTRCRK